MMTRGRGRVSIPPKSDDVIYEQPHSDKEKVIIGGLLDTASLYLVLAMREIVLYSERMKEYIQMVDITSLGSLLPSKANHT